MTIGEKRLQGIFHIVHEYANLVASGEMLKSTFRPELVPPANTHVQHVFLLNCRKMGDFFIKDPEGDDIGAQHFLNSGVTFSLPVWVQWGRPMNKQLAHLTYHRVTKSKSWDGTANEPLLDEFRTAWRLFLRSLDNRYELEFEKQIVRRQSPDEKGNLSEFKQFDLR